MLRGLQKELAQKNKLTRTIPPEPMADSEEVGSPHSQAFAIVEAILLVAILGLIALLRLN